MIFIKRVFVEKYVEGSPIMVVLKSCSNKNYWYSIYVWKTFTVRAMIESDLKYFVNENERNQELIEDYVVLSQNGEKFLHNHYILKKDCEII